MNISSGYHCGAYYDSAVCEGSSVRRVLVRTDT